MTNWPEWTSPDGRIRLINADCLEVLPHLSGVDAVVADPPYGMNNDTDYSRFTGGISGHRDSVTGSGMGRNYGAPIIGDDGPFDPTPFLKYREVLLWGANHFASRLPVGTTLVWIKRNDDAFGSFLSDAELAWKKGGCGVFCRRDLSMNAIATERAHPNQKPVSLLNWCLGFIKGETILDPFAGSCTTAIACIRTDRRCICIEKEPKYYEIGIERCKREYERTSLFDHAEKRQRQEAFV